MRLVLGLVVVVVLAAAAAGVLLREPGYLLLRYGAWTVETTPAVAVVALALLYAAVAVVWRLVRGTRRLPRRFAAWRRSVRRRRARRALVQGLVELAEGHWDTAERLLLQGVADSEAPLLHYLGAARAAQAQGARDRRDRYLKAAGEARPASPLAVALTQAELQRADGQLEQALASYVHARQLAPRHPLVLRRLAELYRELADWESLVRLLRDLRRHRALGDEALSALEREAWRRLLAASPEAWARLPRGLRQEPELVAAHAEALLAAGRTAEAEAALRRAASGRPDPRLAELYGRLSGEGAETRLRTLERWLGSAPEDPVLLLAAGRQAAAARLWGKARSYLEAAVARGAGAEARLELAALLEALGETETAREHYRRGLEERLGHGPALPAAPAPRPLPAADAG
ncbi:heme biosynthesis protein HemY [Inmirania thermothiophila]|uniref:HemY protein n=1 Tax=Inmirania thermothiophila TaxID=1750597 RepID=A0A3N1Y6F7_9GAMM|nr:heme biosynthesis HemY N-terminal domain-containing protein [Inmirania thermothiophila]ROR34393.1 HemY protein [Inmirania thermothiophila]